MDQITDMIAGSDSLAPPTAASSPPDPGQARPEKILLATKTGLRRVDQAAGRRLIKRDRLLKPPLHR